jgi:hypothetical protein
VHALGLEIGLPSEGDIAFIPVEPLVQAINQTIFAFIGSIDWPVNAFILNLSFLLPHVFKLIFITFKLQKVWTTLEHGIENNLVLKICWKH